MGGEGGVTAGKRAGRKEEMGKKYLEMMGKEGAHKVQVARGGKDGGGGHEMKRRKG